mmetsp:Transcript_18446/g.58375  ORF Transcript_18446/g.58375 Transcript_18446/m.58375 type:complete len:479 (-) Transcript_18446:742-2178(-)
MRNRTLPQPLWRCQATPVPHVYLRGRHRAGYWTRSSSAPPPPPKTPSPPSQPRSCSQFMRRKRTPSAARLPPPLPWTRRAACTRRTSSPPCSHAASIAPPPTGAMQHRCGLYSQPSCVLVGRLPGRETSPSARTAAPPATHWQAMVPCGCWPRASGRCACWLHTSSEPRRVRAGRPNPRRSPPPSLLGRFPRHWWRSKRGCQTGGRPNRCQPQRLLPLAAQRRPPGRAGQPRPPPPRLVPQPKATARVHCSRASLSSSRRTCHRHRGWRGPCPSPTRSPPRRRPAAPPTAPPWRPSPTPTPTPSPARHLSTPPSPWPSHHPHSLPRPRPQSHPFSTRPPAALVRCCRSTIYAASSAPCARRRSAARSWWWAPSWRDSGTSRRTRLQPPTHRCFCTCFASRMSTRALDAPRRWRCHTESSHFFLRTAHRPQCQRSLWHLSQVGSQAAPGRAPAPALPVARLKPQQPRPPPLRPGARVAA